MENGPVRDLPVEKRRAPDVLALAQPAARVIQDNERPGTVGTGFRDARWQRRLRARAITAEAGHPELKRCIGTVFQKRALGIDITNVGK